MSGYIFSTTIELRQAVKLFFDNKRECIQNYGEINSWNVSQIEDFSGLFEGRDEFNELLNNWDTSKGLNFSNMFRGCSLYNKPIEWDTSRGILFRGMFRDCISLKYQPNIDLQNSIDNEYAFYNCNFDSGDDFQVYITNGNTQNMFNNDVVESNDNYDELDNNGYDIESPSNLFDEAISILLKLKSFIIP